VKFMLRAEFEYNDNAREGSYSGVQHVLILDVNCKMLTVSASMSGPDRYGDFNWAWSWSSKLPHRVLSFLRGFGGGLDCLIGWF